MMLEGGICMIILLVVTLFRTGWGLKGIGAARTHASRSAWV